MLNLLNQMFLFINQIINPKNEAMKNQTKQIQFTAGIFHFPVSEGHPFHIG
jgi:hypothetical protein